MQRNNLGAGNARPANKIKQKVTKLLEHQILGFHLISTLELFLIFLLLSQKLISFDRSKLAPFILSSWTARPRARLSVFSLFTRSVTFQYLHNFTCTNTTIAAEVDAPRKEGTHHLLHRMTPNWASAAEEVKRRVVTKAWKTRKEQQRWNISRRRVSSLVSATEMRWEKRCSSLCQSLRRRRCPGLFEISIIGCCWIIIAVFDCWSWNSSTIGISTMCVSFDSPIFWSLARQRMNKKEPREYTKL